MTQFTTPAATEPSDPSDESHAEVSEDVSTTSPVPGTSANIPTDNVTIADTVDSTATAISNNPSITDQDIHADSNDDNMSSTGNSDISEVSHKRPRVEHSTSENSESSNGSSEGHDNVHWTACFGKLRNLIVCIAECQVIDTSVTVENGDPRESLLQLMDVVERISSLSRRLLLDAQRSLEVIESDENLPGPNTTDVTPMERDPADRRKIACDADRVNLISYGPFQPKLKYYPKHPDINAKKQCHFSSLWFRNYPHLEYSIRNDAAYCYVCQLFPIGKSQEAWITTGVCQWEKMKSRGLSKPGKLAQHFCSDAHKQSLEKLAAFQNTNMHIDTMLSKEMVNMRIQEASEQERNRESIKILLDISRTLARQGLAFRGASNDDGEEGNFKQIVALVARHNRSFQRWLDDAPKRPHGAKYINPRSQNEYIKLLARDVSRRISAEVDDAGMFAVIADTTPDVSHRDQLSVVARYVKPGSNTASERLVALNNIDDKTGDGQAQAILAAVAKQQIDCNSIAFQSYDYTASMSGVFNGCQAKLTQHLNRDIPYVPCLAHRINTAVEHSCDASTIFSALFDTIQELYDFLSGSTKRYGVYMEHVEAFEKVEGTTVLRLRNLSKTRWVAREESLRAIWSSYGPLLAALLQLQQANYEAKTKVKARGLRSKMQTFEFVVTLMFMRHIMTKTAILTTEAQGVEINIIDTLESVTVAITNLNTIRADEANMDREIKSALKTASDYDIDGEAEFRRRHHTRKVPRRLDENPETAVVLDLVTFYRKEFITVIESQTVALQDNYDAAMNTVKPVVNLLRPPYTSGYTNTDIQRLVDMFPPAIRPDIEVLKTEISAFRCHMKENCTDIETIDDATTYISQRGWLFPLTKRCFQLLHTIPITSASSERSFSKLKLVKSVLRSVMNQDRLQDLLILGCEQDLTDSVNLGPIVDEWAQSIATMRSINV